VPCRTTFQRFTFSRGDSVRGQDRHVADVGSFRPRDERDCLLVAQQPDRFVDGKSSAVGLGFVRLFP